MFSTPVCRLAMPDMFPRISRMKHWPGNASYFHEVGLAKRKILTAGCGVRKVVEERGSLLCFWSSRHFFNGNVERSRLRMPLGPGLAN